MDYIKIILLLTGIGNLFNGIWMLVAPKTWYQYLPAAIPDFGAYNEHFVRDLGIMFSVFGGIMLLAAAKPAMRATVLLILALWFGLHSVLHFFEVARGFVGVEHIWMDIPLTHLPAIVLAVLYHFERGKKYDEVA